MKFSIVIPTYNHCDDLLKPCINSIIENSNLTDVEIVISANGCTDNTKEYLTELTERFYQQNLSNHLKIAWDNSPTGYSRATNDGIKISSGEKIILLNNDVIILPQEKNTWINLLNAQFDLDPMCGISGPSKVFSDPANRNFLIFFCVMIDRKVFDVIGLLNEEYGKGGGEDTEFCILAEDAGFHLNICTSQRWDDNLHLYVGEFPIYHRGEGTVHDINLVPDYNDVFEINSLKLGKKFNPEWYRWKLSNNLERAVYLRGHQVDIREKLRYSWAAKNSNGKRILDIGCSSGYGAQFFPNNVEYVGIDYDAKIIEEANIQNWLPNTKFIHANLNNFENQFKDEYYDTIIAFEVIEHLSDGLTFVEILKNHCDQIIITVPFDESVNVFNPHHLLRNLTPNKFKDFTVIGYINMQGNILNENELIRGEEYSLLIEWKKQKSAILEFNWLNNKYPAMFNEIIKDNCYNLDSSTVLNRNVLDIGANIGAFSLLANFYGAKKIIAVEPVKSTYINLIANTSNTNIMVLPLAVTDKTGDIININVNEDDFNNSVYLIKSKNFEKVLTISLTDLLKFYGNDPKIFLKIDCEGSEFDIIAGATKEDFDKIEQIIVEVHLDVHPIYNTDELINTKLSNFGFILTKTEQMYSYNISETGKPFNMKKLPAKVQFWTKSV